MLKKILSGSVNRYSQPRLSKNGSKHQDTKFKITEFGIYQIFQLFQKFFP
jgi:hypothetical protein